MHDDPELVGAQWWRTALDAQTDGATRRQALLSLAGLSAAGLTVGGALGSSGCCLPLGDDVDLDSIHTDAALAMQREFGWDVGSAGKPLGFPMGMVPGEPVAPELLDTLVARLQPTNPLHAPFYLPVLFQSLTATPTTPEGTPGALLRDVIRPIANDTMTEALERGRGLATLFESAPPGRAVIVDLPGPEAIAFAAGLADRFDPVFVLDNWPHPDGVVDSHLTLAAALAMAPELEAAAAARPATAPPVFVLDANRLAPFDETGTRFDNRYLAPLPSAEQLSELGIQEVIYVRPEASDQELDDLNAEFVEWREAGVEVRLLPADVFVPAEEVAELPAPDPASPPPEPSPSDPYYTSRHHDHHYWYGGPHHHWFFWTAYGFGLAHFVSRPTPFSAPSWRPSIRTTMFSTPSGSRAPSGFGTVSVRRRAGSSPSLTHHPSTGTFGRSSGGRSGA